jgi:hypothetical protein
VSPAIDSPNYRPAVGADSAAVSLRASELALCDREFMSPAIPGVPKTGEAEQQHRPSRELGNGERGGCVFVGDRTGKRPLAFNNGGICRILGANLEDTLARRPLVTFSSPLSVGVPVPPVAHKFRHGFVSVFLGFAPGRIRYWRSKMNLNALADRPAVAPFAQRVSFDFECEMRVFGHHANMMRGDLER